MTVDAAARRRWSSRSVVTTRAWGCWVRPTTASRHRSTHRSPTATVVSVGPEASATTPTTIRVHGNAETAGVTRLLVEVGCGGRGRRHRRPHAAPATQAETLEVRAWATTRGSTLVSLQDWDADAVHVARQRFAVGRDATLRAINATLGGDTVRVYPIVSRTTVPAVTPSCSASSSPTPASTSSTASFVDHGQPHCRSNVAYKGALQGAGARRVWIGDVLIRADAVGTNTYELNRNLLLTDGARADSRAEPRDRDRRDRGRRARQRDRSLRRRAALLPAGARHPRGRGPSPGRAGLLRRRDPAARRRRGGGAAHRRRSTPSSSRWRSA